MIVIISFLSCVWITKGDDYLDSIFLIVYTAEKAVSMVYEVPLKENLRGVSANPASIVHPLVD